MRKEIYLNTHASLEDWEKAIKQLIETNGNKAILTIYSGTTGCCDEYEYCGSEVIVEIEC